MEPAVFTENLCLTYKGGWFGPCKKALQQVSFSVEGGKILGVLGGNGSGKSSLLKVLCGLLPACSGVVRIGGETARLALTRNRLGFVPEKPDYPRNFTVDQLLRLFGRLSGLGDELRSRVGQCLERCQLEGQADLGVGKLSKGAVQRLAMAQALVHDPEVLLLDEPMDGLDPLVRAQFRELVQDLKKEGKCVLLATHLVDGLETLCDELLILHEGMVLFQGPPRFDTNLEAWFMRVLEERRESRG